MWPIHVGPVCIYYLEAQPYVLCGWAFDPDQIQGPAVSQKNSMLPANAFMR